MRGIHVVLVEPRIPGNAGCIGRTCLGLGASLHIVNPVFDPSDKRALRAGVGFWPQVRAQTHDDWSSFEKEILPGLGTPYFFTKFASTSIYDTSFVPPPSDLCLVFGSESEGFKAIPTATLKRHHCIHFPMHTDSIRSYNLAASAAMGLSEAVRQSLLTTD